MKTIAIISWLGTFAYAAETQSNSSTLDYIKSVNQTRQIHSLEHAPKATGIISLNVNLNALDSIISSSFDPKNPDSYEFRVDGIIYDSLGAIHLTSYYFLKDATNSWMVNLYVDETGAGTGELVFDTYGKLISTNGFSNFLFFPETGAVSPQSVSINFNHSTQYASPSRLKSLTQDGYPEEPDFHSNRQSR
jgi:flagellar hook protein FlgE